MPDALISDHAFSLPPELGVVHTLEFCATWEPAQSIEESQVVVEQYMSEARAYSVQSVEGSTEAKNRGGAANQVFS